jgi:CubicO group peptidase (beta-lactamase class C family)
MIRYICGIIASVVCVTAAAAQAASSGLRADLDAALDLAISDHRVVGAVVLVLHDGKVVYHRAAGYADRGTKIPISETTVFRLSSVSKPVVTAAVLALVDKGKIRLDQPVTDFLPGFRPALANGTAPAITIRQLLNHTAGLSYGFLEARDGPYHKFAVSDGMDEVDIGLDEEARRISAAGLAYEPGTKWGYSVAVDVLGGVVAKASGKPLPAAVSELVTGPLHMRDTNFSTTSTARLASAYFDHKPEPAQMNDPEVVPFLDLAGIRFSPGRARRQTAFPSGGAGMVGTAGDVARLLEVVRRGGQPVLRPATAQSMMTNQTADLPVNLSGAGWGFGFGGAVLRDPAAAKTPQSRGTWSWGGVYGHNWFVDPVKKLTVVVMTNTAFEGMAGKLPTDVRDAVYHNVD